jgi:hypothetical protein
MISLISRILHAVVRCVVRLKQRNFVVYSVQYTVSRIRYAVFFGSIYTLV